MTTIITRLYPDMSAAKAAMASLLEVGQNPETIQIITSKSPNGGEAAMKAARIGSAAASAYAGAMTGDQALLVVQAPFNPRGTALNAIRTLKGHPAMDVGLEDEDVYLREYPSVDLSGRIMTRHPLLMSNQFKRLSHGHILGNDPVIRGKQRTSAIRGGAYISRYFWPMKLVSTPKERNSAMRGGFLFSSLFGLPLLTKTWTSRDELPTILR